MSLGITVLAWNLRHGGGADRTPEQLMFLAGAGADVLVLSEFRRSRSTRMLGALADHGFAHHVIAPAKEHENAVAVVSREALEPVSIDAAGGLSAGDGRKDRALSRVDALLARRLCAVRVRAWNMKLCAVHIPDESDPDGRAACWARCVEAARAWAGERAVIAGDFNTSRSGIDPARPGQTCEQQMGVLASLGFVEAWRECAGSLAQPPGVPMDVPTSWFGPRGEAQRLDFAWVSKPLAPALRRAWYQPAAEVGAMSDHAAMWVTLEL